MNRKVEQQGTQLLQARKEALEQMKFGSMRAHGKLWGMDVFSWPNPELDQLAHTVHSFPFQVIWIGSGELILDSLKQHPEIVGNLKSVIAHNAPAMALRNEELIVIPEVVGTLSVEDALEMLRGVQATRTILLFTADGAEWEPTQEVFNRFLELHQVQ